MPKRIIRAENPVSKPIWSRQLDGTLKEVDLRHHEYKNQKLNINGIEKLAELTQENLNKDKVKARIQIIIETPYGHRSGKFFDSINHAHIWSPTDYEYDVINNKNADNITKWYDNGLGVPDSFWFNIIYPELQGGSDPHNDCLYNALIKLLPEKVKKLWTFPSDLKNFLRPRIKRDDMVTIEHIDQIEKKLNIQIIITGDVDRVPKINSKEKINIILKNEHYSVPPNSITKVAGVSYKERKPLACNYDYKNNLYNIYDGETQYIDTVESIREMKKNTMSSGYVVLKVNNKKDLEEEYNNFIRRANKLKVLTKGLVNMYKCGSDKNTALNLFNHYNKATIADKILGVEGMFIMDCYNAGLVYASPYEGTAYQYDVSSMYPSILCSNMTIPYKEGEFKILTKKDIDSWTTKEGKQYFIYGIYKCIITGDINRALFKENKNNTYTHIDLEVAHELGYTIELIENGTCNFLYYAGTTRISLRQLFKAYVDLLYPLKKEHKDDVKSILTIIWGALSEKRIYNKIYTDIIDDKEEIILDYNVNIEDIHMLGNNKMKIETVKCDDIFISGYARLMPFITSQGRKMLSNLITNNVDVDSVKRIHTDSILSSVPLKNTFPNKVDAKLGELGYEGYYESCIVKNMRKPEGVLKF